MTEHAVNGYVVVSAATGWRYQGVDRDPWAVVDAAYYSRALPDEIKRLYEPMKSGTDRGLWWPSATSREVADRLLAFTRAQDPGAELMAVYSPYLQRVLRRNTWTATLEWLGVDVVSVGEWSLLKAIDEAGITPADDVGALRNECGLLADESSLGRVEAYYRELSDRGRLEPLAAAGSGITVEAVRVYRVQQADSPEPLVI